MTKPSVLTIQKTETIHRFLVEKTIKYLDNGSWRSRVDRIYDPDDPRLQQGHPECWKGRASYIERDENGQILACLNQVPHVCAGYLRRALETGSWKPEYAVSDEEYTQKTIEELAKRLAAQSTGGDKVAKALAALLAATKSES